MTAPEDWTAQEQAQAQADIDFHPDASPYWDSPDGQDSLRCAKYCALRPTNTNRERCALYAAARESAAA